MEEEKKWSFTVYMTDQSCQTFEEVHTHDSAITYLQEILQSGLARTYENGSTEAWSPFAIKRVRIQPSDEPEKAIEVEQPAKKPRKKKAA